MGTSSHSIYRRANRAVYSHANRIGTRCLVAAVAVFVVAMAAGVQPASAQRLENAVAVFAALDKVTAKIQRLEIPLDDTVTFGALKVTPRVCFSRTPTERPKTTSFVQINEIELDGSEKTIFSGWMFAQSPGLNALEHPVFDIWLTGCEKPTNAPPASASEPAVGEASEPVRRPPPRRRVRR